jgi:hypothetical protein
MSTNTKIVLIFFVSRKDPSCHREISLVNLMVPRRGGKI